MDIKNDIIQIFVENGVEPSENEELINIDSLQYVAIVIEIENRFEIILPDFILEKNEFIDFERFVSIVKQILEDKEKS